MSNNHGYPTPAANTKITAVRTKNTNSGIINPPGNVTTQVNYPKPNIDSGVVQTPVPVAYPNPAFIEPQTVIQQNTKTKVQKVTKPNPKKFKLPVFQVPNLLPLLAQNYLPLVGAGFAIAALTPLLIGIFPQPRIAFQKTFKIPSQECKDDSGKFLSGRVLILGQDGKTNTLSFCNDTILNGVENGVKRGLSEDQKSFALPTGNYVINKATKFKLGDDSNKAVELPFLYEFAAQEEGKSEIVNNLAKLPSDWTAKHKIASIGVIYPIDQNSNELIKQNKVALELAVKPNSSIYQLHKKNYLDGTTLVVRANLQP